MKTLILTFFIAFATQFTTAQNWKSDPEHSRLGFKIEHMTISEINGIFRDFEIKVKSAKADFSDAEIELSATVGSVDTQVAARDKHLREKDFFDVENHPILEFKSKSIKRTVGNKYTVTGLLTLHGFTKQVTVNMVYNGAVDNPVTKKRTAGFQFTATIRRSDFGIGTKFPAELVGEEVAIVADTELQLQ